MVQLRRAENIYPAFCILAREKGEEMSDEDTKKMKADIRQLRAQINTMEKILAELVEKYDEHWHARRGREPRKEFQVKIDEE